MAFYFSYFCFFWWALLTEADRKIIVQLDPQNNFCSLCEDTEICKKALPQPHQDTQGLWSSELPALLTPLSPAAPLSLTRQSDTDFVNLVTYLSPSVWLLCSVIKKNLLVLYPLQILLTKLSFPYWLALALLSKIN